MSGADGIDVLPEREEEGDDVNPEDYVGDQAYQMYQELLDIVRSGEE